MTRYITILIIALLSYSINAQSTHEVTVAINQGVECPVVAGLNESDLFSIYPNPVEFSFTIESSIKEAEIKLSDLNGRNVRTRKMINGKMEVEVSDLPSGIYILHFLHEDGADKIKIKIQ